MDLIQQELLKKRETLSSQTKGKRFFKRSEIEQIEIKKLREEERREIEAKTLRQISAVDSSSTPASKSTATKTSSGSAAATSSSSPALTNEQNIDNLDLPKSEVVRRLRFLKQPATLFGEDDPARLERLKHVLRTGAFEVDSDMTEGQTNDFLRDIAELRKRQKTGGGGGAGSGGKRQKRGGGNGGGGGGGGSDDGEGDEDNGASSGADVEKDLRRMRADFGELCDEDKILVFFKKLLNEWKQELDEMPDAGKRTANGRSMVANFKQCARYLHPLFKFCRKKILPADIRRALLIMVDYCMKRDYLAAMDHYIKMAIGNAPWPIGVTMVGIHERSAREKIYTNSVAHIMNDETTRKYLQSVKRLMTYCQRRYPTMPSKAVEFNSLANGSDLQSLLAEERGFAGNQAPEERLRLMPAPNEG